MKANCEPTRRQRIAINPARCICVAPASVPQRCQLPPRPSSATPTNKARPAHGAQLAPAMQLSANVLPYQVLAFHHTTKKKQNSRADVEEHWLLGCALQRYKLCPAAVFPLRTAAPYGAKRCPAASAAVVQLHQSSGAQAAAWKLSARKTKRRSCSSVTPIPSPMSHNSSTGG